MGKYCIRSCFVGLTMLVCVINIYAQPPDTTWTKTFGANEYAGAYSVQQTSDWGYIIVGSIRYLNEDYGDIWLIKTDPLGDSLWARTYGGDKGESASSVHQTPDKGYIIGGYTNSFGAGLYDAWLIKTDSLGNVRWAKTYGGSNDDLVFSIEQTSDNGYVMAGSTQSFGNGGYDMLLIKTDSLGNFLWMKTYGGPDDDGCASVKQTEDNGYILAGATFSFGAGENDCYLVKTDSLGDTIITFSSVGPRPECVTE